MKNQELIAQFRSLVGAKYVLTGAGATQRFRKGFRSGIGEAICVVQPGGLLEFWRVLQACVAQDKIVIFQAANTGVTEGSTPKGSYDRDVVIIHTSRMKKIVPVDGARQIIAQPGASLFELEQMLLPIGREPHSVLGSSGIGSTIVGGICNNAGGSLINRGPSFTQLALYARLDENGELKLINHLGVDLGETPEEMLTKLEAAESFDDLPQSNKKASDDGYQKIICDVSADSPARFNNDKRLLHEVSGCAGKLAVFAVRVDTFEKLNNQQAFYIGTNDAAVIAKLRNGILSGFENLPVSGEYLHRGLYDGAKRYGKDTILLIDKLGTKRLPKLFAFKGRLDAWFNKFSLTRGLSDKILQFGAYLVPNILPKRMEEFRDQFEHHFILKTYEAGNDEARSFLSEFFQTHEGDFFECSAHEAKMASLLRYAAGGTAVRYLALNGPKVEGLISLDIALRRNDANWCEELPQELEQQIEHKFFCGHMFCHVMHQDYIVKKGCDMTKLKEAMLKILDERGAAYPSEHNVGHVYQAHEDLQAHYKACDPTNSFNPGIGKMSRKKNYA